MSVSDIVASAALELRLASQRSTCVEPDATLRLAATLLSAAAEFRRLEHAREGERDQRTQAS